MKRILTVLWNTGLRLLTIVFFLSFLSVMPDKAGAQGVYTLNNAPSLNIPNYALLPDAHYSLKQVQANANLIFKPDSLKPAICQYYWVKIIIYNPYPNNENYLFSFSKVLNYTLYYYQPGTKKWISKAAGLNILNGERQQGIIPCVLQRQAVNTFYLKIDLSEIKAYKYAIKPAIIMQKEVVFDAQEGVLRLSYFICCIVLLSFSFYNLYIYFNLKDKAYLYYVIVQAGALIYLTANKLFFNLIFPFTLYNVSVIPPGKISYFDINILFEHIGVTILFCGFIQFTRVYLGTKIILPVYDKVLQWLCYTYAILEIVPITITITRLSYLNNVLEANLFILVIIAACIITGVAAVKRKVKVAKFFLAAYLLPLLVTAAASVYVLINLVSNPILVEMAVISQIFTFAVALVARVKHINDELKEKAIQAIRLEADITVTEYKRLLIEEENKNITLTIAIEKERNDLLQQRLEANQRELVGNSVYIHQKNKLLADLKSQIHDMDDVYPDGRPNAFKNIQSSLSDGDNLDEEWNKFKLHFEQVHPDFFKDLIAKHPALTKYELRLYAYFHIHLSTREIAALLNIAPASVRQAKTRLNKKMSI